MVDQIRQTTDASIESQREQLIIESCRSFAENMYQDTAVVLVNRQGKVIFTHAQPWSGMLMRSLTSGANLLETLEEHDYLVPFGDAAKKAMAGEAVEFEIQINDSHRHIKIAPFNGRGEFVTIFIRNLDEIKRNLAEIAKLETTIAGLEKQTQDAIKLLRQFRHDASTPLTAMLSSIPDVLEAMKTFLPTLPQVGRLEHALDAAKDIQQIIARTIDLVNAHGLYKPKMAQIDVVALARRILVQQTDHLHLDRRRAIVTAGALMSPIFTNETLVKAILTNLVNNALKYSPAATEPVIVNIRTGIDYWYISVEDHGIGIPAAELEQLMQSAEFRASNTGDIPGTGLGLEIVRNAVGQLKGQISVRSMEGKGTVVTVKLPNPAGASEES
jgi:signal transduction histidine kinase